MRNSSLLMAFTLWLLSVGCLTPVQQANWTVVNSPNFEIMSTMSVDETTKLAEDLERFRALIYSVTTAPNEKAPIPTHIFAFARQSEYAAFRPNRDMAGFFRPGIRANHVVLVDSSNKLDATTILFHEYVHFVLRNATTTSYPIWYDEGFAEVLSTVTTHEGKLIVGAVPKARINSFLYGEWLSMNRVLEATSYSSVPRDELHMLYAEAWALAHYVTLDRPMTGSTDEYLSLLKAGHDPETAYEQSYGESINQTALNIRHKLKQGDWRLIGIPLEHLKYDRSAPTIRKPTEDEVSVRLGQLHLSGGKAREAQVLFEQALVLNPSNDRAHAGLGDAFKFQSKLEIAEAHFRKAVELDPSNFLNQLDLAEYLHDVALSEPRGEKRTRYMAEARSVFSTTEKLAPDLPETRLELGRTYLAAGEDPARSLPLIESAYRLLPSVPATLSQLGEAYLANGKEIEAREFYRRLASIQGSGSNPDEITERLDAVRKKRVEADRQFEKLGSVVDE